MNQQSYFAQGYVGDNPITTRLTNHEQRKKWIIYLIWGLLLVGALAGVWWYYHREIDRLDRELDTPLHQPRKSMGFVPGSTSYASGDKDGLSKTLQPQPIGKGNNSV